MWVLDDVGVWVLMRGDGRGVLVWMYSLRPHVITHARTGETDDPWGMPVLRVCSPNSLMLSRHMVVLRSTRKDWTHLTMGVGIWRCRSCWIRGP